MDYILTVNLSVIVPVLVVGKGLHCSEFHKTWKPIGVWTQFYL